MPRHLAPAGAPIGGRDLVSWCRRWPRLDESGEELRASICTTLNRRHCWLTSTGRAGLAILLSALKALAPPERDEVILPSYTCYSVPASAVRAGLRPRIVDIDPVSLDFDLERLGNTDFRRVVAVIPTSLYGLPSQLDRIAGIARDNNIFLVDDAAQSLGAAQRGRPAGGWGDAGLLSFDKGKAISAIDGGAIVADDDTIAEAVDRRWRKLQSPGVSTNLELGLKVWAYATCLRPRLYWIPRSLPGLGLGQTDYRPDFTIGRASPWMAALAATMWGHLAGFVASRASTAARYIAGIRAVESLTPILPVPGADPSYLRFPVLAADRALRNALVRDLQEAGVGATASYQGSIADIPALRGVCAVPPDADAGRAAAGLVLTLPTHPYVTPADVERAVAVITATLARHRGFAVA